MWHVPHAVTVALRLGALVASASDRTLSLFSAVVRVVWPAHLIRRKVARHFPRMV